MVAYVSRGGKDSVEKAGEVALGISPVFGHVHLAHAVPEQRSYHGLLVRVQCPSCQQGVYVLQQSGGKRLQTEGANKV